MVMALYVLCSCPQYINFGRDHNQKFQTYNICDCIWNNLIFYIISKNQALQILYHAYKRTLMKSMIPMKILLTTIPYSINSYTTIINANICTL